MGTYKVFGIILVVGGALALALGSFSYTRETHSADIGTTHLAVYGRQQVNIPKWAGFAALIGGVLLLATSRRAPD